MEPVPGNFEINLDGLTYRVERCVTGQNIYKLHGQNGSYLVAKDLYNIWVELNRNPGSANISLAKIGRQIEDHYKMLV